MFNLKTSVYFSPNLKQFAILLLMHYSRSRPNNLFFIYRTKVALIAPSCEGDAGRGAKPRLRTIGRRYRLFIVRIGREWPIDGPKSPDSRPDAFYHAQMRPNSPFAESFTVKQYPIESENEIIDCAKWAITV